MVRLTSITYPDSSSDFVRVRDDATDDEVHAVISVALSGLDGVDEDATRTLDEASVDVLRLFAMRRTLQARRRSSVGLIDEALDAYALMPSEGDVPWESWLKAALFYARDLGRDLDSLAARFYDVARAPMAERFAVALESMHRVTELGQCRLIEVTTDHGTGLVEMLSFRDTPITGLHGVRLSRVREADVPFEPATNLAQLAASLADAIDATGGHACGPIGQDQLAETLFDHAVVGSYVETTGCLSFYVDAHGGDASCMVYVAELPATSDASALALEATTHDQAGYWRDSRLVVVCANPDLTGDEDPVMATSMYDAVVADVLVATAPGRWLAQS